MELNEIVKKLKNGFTKENVKKAVLDKEWYGKNISSGIDSTGFCYIASEIIYRLDGGKDKWKKTCISLSDWEYGSHYYLINKKTNEILDITKDQYDSLGIEIPYNLGRCGAFMTSNFSKRARKLAELCELTLE